MPTHGSSTAPRQPQVFTGYVRECSIAHLLSLRWQMKFAFHSVPSLCSPRIFGLPGNMSIRDGSSRQVVWTIPSLWCWGQEKPALVSNVYKMCSCMLTYSLNFYPMVWIWVWIRGCGHEEPIIMAPTLFQCFGTELFLVSDADLEFVGWFQRTYNLLKWNMNCDHMYICIYIFVVHIFLRRRCIYFLGFSTGFVIPQRPIKWLFKV